MPGRMIARFKDPTLRQSRGAQGADRDFQIPVLEMTDLPASPIARWLMITLCSLLGVTLLAACIGHVDIYAVASGRIEASGRSRVIQPLEAGRVMALHVKNGSRVHKGDLLVEMDPTEADADRTTDEQKISEIDAEVARRTAAIAAVRLGRINVHQPVVFPQDADAASRSREELVLRADLQRLAEDVAELEEKIQENEAQRAGYLESIAANRVLEGTQRSRYQLRDELAAKNWETRANVLDALGELQRTQTDIATEEGDAKRAEATIAAARSARDSSIAHFIEENQQGLEQAERKRRESNEELIKASVKLDAKRLWAPIDGTIQALSITTLGQIVSAGEQLMMVVPESEALDIEALVTNTDIGFVEVGQSAIVKMDTFPFARYGTLDADVAQVSRDSLTMRDAQSLASSTGDTATTPTFAAEPIQAMQNLVFPVKLTLRKAALLIDGRTVQLTPGLTCVVEIKTGQRSVISYLVSPVVEVTSDALHER